MLHVIVHSVLSITTRHRWGAFMSFGRMKNGKKTHVFGCNPLELDRLLAKLSETAQQSGYTWAAPRYSPYTVKKSPNDKCACCNATLARTAPAPQMSA
eukprot:352223-Chlamydomonas_euryale.AAC.6